MLPRCWNCIQKLSGGYTALFSEKGRPPAACWRGVGAVFRSFPMDTPPSSLKRKTSSCLLVRCWSFIQKLFGGYTALFSEKGRPRAAGWRGVGAVFRSFSADTPPSSGKRKTSSCLLARCWSCIQKLFGGYTALFSKREDLELLVGEVLELYSEAFRWIHRSLQ